MRLALDLIFHAPACPDAAIDTFAYCDTHATTALETIKIMDKDVEGEKNASWVSLSPSSFIPSSLHRLSQHIASQSSASCLAFSFPLIVTVLRASPDLKVPPDKVRSRQLSFCPGVEISNDDWMKGVEVCAVFFVIVPWCLFTGVRWRVSAREGGRGSKRKTYERTKRMKEVEREANTQKGEPTRSLLFFSHLFSSSVSSGTKKK